jgi:hypothetical protein
MGMFDELRCEAPLPRPEMQDRTFQTKDMNCVLEEYTITREGRLVCHPHRLEANPDWVDDPSKGIAGLFGMLQRVDLPSYDRNYHGDIYFYDFDKPDAERAPGDYGDLITFRARFTDGQLTSIIEVPE